MSIGKTPMDIHLQIALSLDDAIGWYESHTEDVKKLIIQLIKSNQLKNRGVDKFNQIIGLYSWTTSQMNPEKVFGTPYTLEDSGLFYESMFVVVLNDSILIEAETKHMEGNEWWTTNILGLNEENLQIYIDKIKQNFIQYTRWTLGIN